MKKVIFFLLVIILVVFVWWFNLEPDISEEEAEAVIVEQHASEIGKITIVSIQKRWGNYIVEWENKENCENGTDVVDGNDREIIKGEASVC